MNIELVCKHCKKTFVCKKRGNKTQQIFCSSRCFGDHNQKKKECVECGKIIIYNKVNARTNKKFCSKDCSINFRKKGIPDNIKIKMSKSKIGKPLSKTHRQALTGIAKESLRGKNHHNYKSGEYANGKQRCRTRIEYVQWRKSVFERDKYTCIICKQKGGYLEADHIKPWCDFVDLRYDVTNGRTLCKKCHMYTDTYGNRRKIKNG